MSPTFSALAYIGMWSGIRYYLYIRVHIFKGTSVLELFLYKKKKVLSHSVAQLEALCPHSPSLFYLIYPHCTKVQLNQYLFFTYTKAYLLVSLPLVDWKLLWKLCDLLRSSVRPQRFKISVKIRSQDSWFSLYQFVSSHSHCLIPPLYYSLRFITLLF